MTDETQVRYGPYKIWRNPASRQDSIAYLGEYYPPAGRIFLVALDLLELGFGPGEYTLRAPEQRKFPTLVPKWQRLKLSR